MWLSHIDLTTPADKFKSSDNSINSCTDTRIHVRFNNAYYEAKTGVEGAHQRAPPRCVTSTSSELVKKRLK